jgi:hypothetical protein
MNIDDYSAAVKAELAYPGELQLGATGLPVKRVQEWLCFHGNGTAIDSDFGTGTRKALALFQASRNIHPDGRMTDETWASLVAPLRSVLADGTGTTLRDRVTSIAKNHLAIHPVELGGNNRGPWVRIYTGGQDGSEWLWCAGFVTFVLKQAYAELKMDMPIRGSVSCDTLAAQAQSRGLFVSEAQAAGDWNALGDVYVFLVRKTSTDWTHTGFGFGGTSDAFSTIEGNANENGERGYEVCSKTRAGLNKDFIVLR